MRVQRYQAGQLVDVRTPRTDQWRRCVCVRLVGKINSNAPDGEAWVVTRVDSLEERQTHAGFMKPATPSETPE